MTVKTILAIACAGLLWTLVELPASGAAQALQISPMSLAKTAILVAQRGSRFDRCMARCNNQGYNTRLCPSKCGARG
jgi:hypothetical protein